MVGKKLVLFVFSWCLFSSCTEKYKNIDPKNFNDKIRDNISIKTPVDLIYASALIKKTKSLSVNSKALDNHLYQITAIVDVYDDDALKAEKYVVIANHSVNHWHILEIRYNWQNRDGYGHTDWGI